MMQANTERFSWPAIIAGIILILFTIVVTWSIPRGNGDLTIALAAGNDVLAGHINQSDDWSFSTDGKIWVNQNWGAGVILAIFNNAFGGVGLLVLKMFLLVSAALFLVLALKEIKIPLVIALAVTAAIMISLNIYTLLRPNLFTITLLSLELWLLYKTERHPRFIWPVALLIVLWANIHAGFIYGLGMLFLWTAYKVIPGFIQNKGAEIKKSWPLLAAALVALLGAGFLNPFGLTNLTFPFMMVKGGAWLMIRDWQPIWANGLWSFTVGIFNFLVVLGIVLLLLIIQIVCNIIKKLQARHNNPVYADSETQPCATPNANFISGSLIDWILAIVAVVMAVFSNRFIPIALIMLAPLLARQLLWLAGLQKVSWIAPAALGCLTLVYSVFMFTDILRNYNPDNPFINTGIGSLADRMHYYNMSYNSQLVRFINDNKISGNVISPWSWEGYLRLNCPQLKVLIGGRAQQIYSEDTLNRYLYITGTNIPAFHGHYLEDVLASVDAHFIIASNTEESDDLILSALNCGNWVIVYADEKGLIFANTNWPDSASMVEKFRAGELVFDKYITKVTSTAAFVFSQPELWKSRRLDELFAEAWSLQPVWLWSYQVLFTFCRSDMQLFGRIINSMKSQLDILEEKELSRSDAAEILNCRMYLASALAEFANSNGELITYEKMQNSFQKAKELYAGLLKRWQQLLIH